jgi:hypothetical protein
MSRSQEQDRTTSINQCYSKDNKDYVTHMVDDSAVGCCCSSENHRFLRVRCVLV